jgi:hypothetical protein
MSQISHSNSQICSKIGMSQVAIQFHQHFSNKKSEVSL